MKDLSSRVNELEELINKSEHIIIGAGSGLSTAAGIDYGGERFKNNFSDFIDKYNFTDMYTAGFYPFKKEEAKWAYWAKHIYTNNTGMKSTKLYEKLFKLVEDKDYFVITTNVDNQFNKSGFNPSKIFQTQGSYSQLQCKKACHNKLYDATDIVQNMIKNTNSNLEIPSELIPKCPVCGGLMDVNLRKDEYFVEDETWHTQSRAYNDFINKARDDKTLLLEFGIGYNTPGIIRFPFETMASKITNWNLARFNKEHLEVIIEEHKTYKLLPIEMIEKVKLENNFQDRYLPFSEDIESIIDTLLK